MGIVYKARVKTWPALDILRFSENFFETGFVWFLYDKVSFALSSHRQRYCPNHPPTQKKNNSPPSNKPTRPPPQKSPSLPTYPTPHHQPPTTTSHPHQRNALPPQTLRPQTHHQNDPHHPPQRSAPIRRTRQHRNATSAILRES